MIKHPEQLGFTLGLKIVIGQPESITPCTPAATDVHDVVYVALLAEHSGQLEKGDALKIGQAGKSLMKRWKGIAGIFKPGRKLRNTEVKALESWLGVANGKGVSVWMRKAGT